MVKTREILYVWKKVFGRAKYFTLGVLAFFLFYSLNAFLANINNIKSFYSALGFYEFLKFLFSLILIFTIFKASKDLTTCDICKINLKKDQNMKGGKN